MQCKRCGTETLAAEKYCPQCGALQDNTSEPLVLGAEQAAFLCKLEDTDSNIFITGKAGTGKSVLLRYFIEHTKKAVVIVAPTGIAALNVGGQTIHSLFQIGLGPQDVSDKSKMKISGKTKAVLEHIETLVIDEMSMVTADILDTIDQKLQFAKKNNRPFGGVQIICFGDLYQLPPFVGTKALEPFYRDHYSGQIHFFMAHIFPEACFKIYELRHAYRQTDKDFLTILDSIRTGSVTQAMLDKINERVVEPPPDTQAVILAGLNETVWETNARELAKLPGKPVIYSAKIDGEIVEKSVTADVQLELKVGAQVMMLNNDRESIPGRWANGTLGVISKLDKDSVHVIIDGTEHQVARLTWQSNKYEYSQSAKELSSVTTGTFVQFPLKLAWAITIHKSQGQTYQSVIIDLTRGAFASGQTYVALSRCRFLETLYLKSPLVMDDIKADPMVLAFMGSAIYKQMSADDVAYPAPRVGERIDVKRDVAYGNRNTVAVESSAKEKTAKSATKKIEDTKQCNTSEPSNTLLVSVNKTARDGQSAFELYEMARSAWTIADSAVKTIQFVVALKGDKVLEVYEVAGWFHGGETMNLRQEISVVSNIGNEGTRRAKRWEFVGNFADASLRETLKGSTLSSWRKQAGNVPFLIIPLSKTLNWNGAPQHSRIKS
jgi:hypothetical protein